MAGKVGSDGKRIKGDSRVDFARDMKDGRSDMEVDEVAQMATGRNDDIDELGDFL